MFVSVIIPTKDRPEAVVNAVESVFAGSYQNFELFVIDQSSGDATEDALAGISSRRERFHYVRNRKPGVGAASSRNLGIALSSGEILAIIDDDVTVQPDWLERIVADFTADPDLQFICGKLTAPPYDWREGFTPSFDAPPGISKWAMPLAAAGANFSMRRTLFGRIGGYDEYCGPGSRLGASDDGDLTWRIVRSGAKWKASPEIEVIHTYGFRHATNGAALLQRYQRGLGGNFGRFARRGDVIAALFFVQWQVKEVIRGVTFKLCGRQDSGLGWVWVRAVGFLRGFSLSPQQGFISGVDLERLRETHESSASVFDDGLGSQLDCGAKSRG